MNKKVLLIIAVCIAILAILGTISALTSNNEVKPVTDTETNNGAKIEEDKLTIVTSTFSSYDFIKHIVGDKANLEYLLGPGVDSHSYEPSTKDLIKIQESDMFVYIGGEMESWIEKVIDNNILDTNDTMFVKVSDAVETIEEVEVDGAEEEEEEEEGAFDEHIWTSPSNAVKMLEYLCNKISSLDEKNRAFYENNMNAYKNQIVELRSKIQEIVDDKVRDRLVFGDKMPMQYFLNEFGLTASAAFNGCSTETEPSTKTITYLINKVKEENIPVVLYIELSSGKTAKAIANEANIKAVQIQTLHNISKEDFDNGETYVSLMTRNLNVLKQALQ